MYIPTGDIVLLVAFIGVDTDNNGAVWDNVWHIKLNRFLVAEDTNNLIMEGRCSAIYLLPLGDKQTQDELAKEKELEDV